MKEVLVRTKPKDSFTLVVSDSSATIQTTFNLETYYSFSHIRDGVLMVARLGQFSMYLQDAMN